MPAIAINDVEYFYQRQGAGPPLILLHGFGGSSRSWAGLIDTLDEKLDIVALDLLGHGRSASPEAAARYAMQRAAEDVMALIARLGLHAPSLLGYSMGGRLALYLAHRYPHAFQQLILESSSPGLAGADEREQRRKSDYELARRIEKNGLEAFTDYWEAIPLFSTQATVPEQRRAALRKQRLENHAGGLANSLRGMGTGSQPSLWESLALIDKPILLLCGELDQKFVRINERMSAKFPRATLKVVEAAGHNVHFEKPDQFAAAISHFLFDEGAD